MKRSDKKQSGEIILFVVFVVLFLLMFVSLFISKVLIQQVKTADNVASSIQAFYVADSGAEYSLYNFKNVCDETNVPPACIGTPPYFVSGGQCIVAYNAAGSTIAVTGTYNAQTSRAIELSWTAP